MALNDLFCPNVPLRNYSLVHAISVKWKCFNGHCSQLVFGCQTRLLYRLFSRLVTLVTINVILSISL